MNQDDIPRKYRQLHERALSGRSRKAAIRAFCLSCQGWSERGTRECTDHDCCLWPYRMLRYRLCGEGCAPGEATEPDGVSGGSGGSGGEKPHSRGGSR